MTKTDATREIKRLGGLDFFPNEPIAVTVLVETLQRRAQTLEHARRAIDWWLERQVQAPKPMELVEALEQTMQSGASRANPTCEACQGSGWAAVYRLVTLVPRKDAPPETQYEHITREQYDVLAERLREALKAGAEPTQQVLTAARRCHCAKGRAA